MVERALLGGLHAAKIIDSSSEGEQIKPRNTEESLETNVTAFGNIIQIFFEACSSCKKFGQVSYKLQKIYKTMTNISMVYAHKHD